jgi:hypothetical protein
LLGEFLISNRNLLEQLGPALGDTFFRTFNAQGPAAAWDLLTQNLAPPQVSGLLAATQREFSALADQHHASDGARVLADTLAQTALGLLLRALVSAL